jgi:hypothetical protein
MGRRFSKIQAWDCLARIFCAVIVFPVAMAVRLIATPIVNIFEPQDKPFNIPRS